MLTDADLSPLVVLPLSTGVKNLNETLPSTTFANPNIAQLSSETGQKTRLILSFFMPREGNREDEAG